MNTAIVCLTEQGYKLGQRIKEGIAENKQNVVLYAPNRAFTNPKQAIIFDSLASTVKVVFHKYRKIIFIMALGIVVRMIAQHIKDKTTDPAVVVIDEAGENVISVLSGHLGGANKLARNLAQKIGARPVITTATDVRGLPAVDDLAREYNLVLDPIKTVRRVNGAIVNGETVHIYTPEQLPITNCPNVKLYNLNDYANTCSCAAYRVIITNRVMHIAPEDTLFLRPRNLVVGVGCRSGTAKENILNAIKVALARCDRSLLSVRALATIDHKAGEIGLQKAASTLKIPLVCFSATEINSFISKTSLDLQHSSFVKKIMGVPGVCEPTALLTTRKGDLILPKQKFQGITVALAQDQYSLLEQDREQLLI